MRVIAGEARGFQLKGPPNRATRPMNDKLKGALFSSFASLGIAPSRVLDLYAGTGSLGIEALSRGAESAEFVDQQAAACAVIRANLAHTRYADVARVHQVSVQSFLTRRGTEPFDLVILDPPYADPEILATLHQVAISPLVQSGGVITVGHSPRVVLPESVGEFSRLRHRCHGDSCFSIYEWPASVGASSHGAGTGGSEEPEP